MNRNGRVNRNTPTKKFFRSEFSKLKNHMNKTHRTFKFGKIERSEELFGGVFLFTPPFLFTPIDGNLLPAETQLNRLPNLKYPLSLLFPPYFEYGRLMLN